MMVLVIGSRDRCGSRVFVRDQRDFANIEQPTKICTTEEEVRMCPESASEVSCKVSSLDTISIFDSNSRNCKTNQSLKSPLHVLYTLGNFFG